MNLDTDNTLSNNSDYYIASQKAVKSYVDNNIPTVNNATLTIKQNSTSKGTFTANSSSDIEINLTDTTYSTFTGADGSNAGTSGLVPAPTATDNTKYLKGDGTWATVSANLPSQTGNSGKFLTTNGTDASWSSISQLPSQTDQNGKYLTTNGTTASWTTLTIPTTTNSVTSGSTAALTSGGAYSNLITSVVAHSTDANKINVTKAGTTTTITINNVGHATSADSATTASSASSVDWDNINNVPSSFAPSAHTHTTADVTALTGYTIASTASAITATDTLNEALGKLQKSIDGKQASGSYVPTSRTINSKALSSDITLTASDVGALPDSTTIPTVDQVYSGSSTNAQSGVAVKSAIDTAISSAYKAAGSVAFASLPTLSASVEGYVYNVSDAFTTTADFVEGAGKSYPAGTNVVCINTSGTTYKWDVLAGFVDLSAYQLTSTAVTHTVSTAAGSSSQPVYVNSSGVATACTYELNKTVPSDAVFTDTTYSVFIGAGSSTDGAAGLVKKPVAGDNVKYLKGDGAWASISYTELTNVPSSFAPAAHTHVTQDVTALTGYTIASTAASIAATDTLNQALGKLQKSIDGKQASGSYVTTTTTVNGKALSGNISLDASDVGALPSSTVVLKRYTATNPALTKASDNTCTWTQTNSTGSTYAIVQIIETSTGKIVSADTTVGASNITVVFNYGSNITAGTYTMIMIG